MNAVSHALSPSFVSIKPKHSHDDVHLHVRRIPHHHPLPSTLPLHPALLLSVNEDHSDTFLRVRARTAVRAHLQGIITV